MLAFDLVCWTHVLRVVGCVVLVLEVSLSLGGDGLWFDDIVSYGRREVWGSRLGRAGLGY